MNRVLLESHAKGRGRPRTGCRSRPGGTAPFVADVLVKTCVDGRPLVESMEVALDVIAARFIGSTGALDLLRALIAEDLKDGEAG